MLPVFHFILFSFSNWNDLAFAWEGWIRQIPKSYCPYARKTFFFFTFTHRYVLYVLDCHEKFILFPRRSWSEQNNCMASCTRKKLSYLPIYLFITFSSGLIKFFPSVCSFVDVLTFSFSKQANSFSPHQVAVLRLEPWTGIYSFLLVCVAKSLLFSR